MDGSRKLQDIFVDAKVPERERRHIPIFECGGAIVWIPGYRIARDWAVPEAASTSLQLRVVRI
jgi:tRNA(Ile)-lysidine synthase